MKQALFLTILAGGGLYLVGCSTGLKPVDIDAPGYSDGALQGDELLDVAMNYSLANNLGNIVSIRRDITASSLAESDKRSMLMRVEFLDTQASEDREILVRYRKDRISERDKRQVFRAVVDRLEKTAAELRDMRQRLRGASPG